MEKPEMIIFDYGHTLLYQPDFNTSNGNKAIYPYISRNPRNISFEEYDKTILELFAKIRRTRQTVNLLNTICLVYQSEKDEMVSRKSAKFLGNNSYISIKILKNSGHYYYDKADWDFLMT